MNDSTKSGSDPTAAPTCGPDPEIPNHPGCVEFVFPDGHSEITPAREVPDSIKFVDGKPVVKIVNYGGGISQIGADGNELKHTLAMRPEWLRPSGTATTPRPPSTNKLPFGYRE